MQKAFFTGLVLMTVLLITSTAYAQYSYKGKVYEYPHFLDANSRPYKTIFIKGADHYLYIYANQPDTPGISFKVLELDLMKEKVADSFFLPSFANTNQIKDIIPGKTPSETIFVRYSELISFKDGEVVIEPKDKQRRFNHYVKINDSLALLYELYDYHPLDGPTGLHLSVYNTHSRTFRISKSVEFPGIIMGSMAVSLVTADKNYIYAFTGLTGRVFKYDLNLQLVSTDTIKELFSNEAFAENSKFEQETDSFIYGEHHRLKRIFEELGNKEADKSSVPHSDIYSKDYVWNSILEVRNKHSFIERVITVKDGEVYLTIAHPEYKFYYRDIICYDLKSGKVLKKMAKVQSAVNDTLRVAEDYFSVDFINDPVIAPYFYKDAAYGINLFDPEIYSGESKDAFDEKTFNYTKQHGYKWQISKYALKR